MWAHRCFWPRCERTESDTRSCDFSFSLRKNLSRSTLMSGKKYNTGAVAKLLEDALSTWWMTSFKTRKYRFPIYVVSYKPIWRQTRPDQRTFLLYGHPARHRLRATRLEWQKTSSFRPNLAAYMCLSSQLRLAWSGYKAIWCDLKKLCIHIIPFSVAMQNQHLWPESRERVRSPSPACAIVQTEAFTDTYVLAQPGISKNSSRVPHGRKAHILVRRTEWPTQLACRV